MQDALGVNDDSQAKSQVAAYWSCPPQELLTRSGSTPRGLTEEAAAARCATFGPNEVSDTIEYSTFSLLAKQFRSPLILVLVFASAIAGLVRDWIGTAIIVIVVVASAALGFLQEARAANCVRALRQRLAVTCTVRRDGVARKCPVRDIVPGDVVELSAGSLVPADGVLLAAKDCFVIQSVLTGESTPVEKTVKPTAPTASLAARTNVLFMGTSLRSGTATMLVQGTGRNTAFGAIAARLRLKRPETDFERGVRRFSMLLTEFVMVLTVIVIAINILMGRPPLESLLFAVALAVGITPELLPAVVSVTLSHGARVLATRGVLIRHLAAIENLGGMSVLCSDKTGTLTEGATRLKAAVDTNGVVSERVLSLAGTNARLQTGLANPLDEVLVTAIGTETPASSAEPVKVDERPYDFIRKRMSVTVVGNAPHRYLTITKGAVSQVLDVCTTLSAPGRPPLDAAARARILDDLERHARDGHRVLAVASRETAEPVASESEMVLEGLLLFEDPVKSDVADTLAELAALGVEVKIVTGDNRFTASHVATLASGRQPRVLTGEDLQEISDEALWHKAAITDVFAEVDPNQKERIILALRRRGAVVGYIGDGINDAPALHAADVGISVFGAVDVAREAADIVLLEHDLRSIVQAVRQGRATFANTQKYLLSTTSANFGNMLSMAAASAFLPFLPLLAPQILLNNLLTDIPSLSLAGDRVDPERVERASRWDITRIRRFTIAFGSLSSVFDVLTFAILLRIFDSYAPAFRSGWFLESLATEVLVLLAIRTRRPLLSSRPSRPLVISSALTVIAAVLFVQLHGGEWLGMPALPVNVLAILAGITVTYVGCVELLKTRLFRST